MQILKVKLEYAKRSFYFSGVENLNDIPNNIREKESIARFRTGFGFLYRQIPNLLGDNSKTSSRSFGICLYKNPKPSVV